jgi:hypothetical protein
MVTSRLAFLGKAPAAMPGHCRKDAEKAADEAVDVARILPIVE